MYRNMSPLPPFFFSSSTFVLIQSQFAILPSNALSLDFVEHELYVALCYPSLLWIVKSTNQIEGFFEVFSSYYTTI